MTTHISHSMTYNGDMETVRAMVLDKGFREEVCEAQRVLRHEVSVTEDAEATIVRVEQVQGAAGLPSFATKLVGEEITIIRTETWRGVYADVEVVIPGKPGEIRGTATLVEDGASITEDVELDVNVRIPLVGGKVEKLIADMLIKALNKEEKVGCARLSS
ncbi:DUF2505 domain-containing protein [Nocardioides bruguierae]|uniref:DUF2505 domain-containing protein n=1 Tax=Nocardioides bruguierae TaxID=2945102 RepID=A0A9X2D7D2_9ACTN|nr:DUF2505 domain-containing protein [Nocardioides bruguierae]MCM0620536.1 DUF2505 domain-containing protein [Nocardioides bruguierae]